MIRGIWSFILEQNLAFCQKYDFRPNSLRYSVNFTSPQAFPHFENLIEYIVKIYQRLSVEAVVSSASVESKAKASVASVGIGWIFRVASIAVAA